MLVTCLFTGIGLTAAWFFYCYRHYKKLYKDAINAKSDASYGLERAVAEVGRLKRLNEKNKELAEKMISNNRDLNNLCQLGWRNLQYRVYRDSIDVVGVYGKNLYFTIKSIQIETDDPSDKEFAIREAEELIETIKNF